MEMKQFGKYHCDSFGYEILANDWETIVYYAKARRPWTRSTAAGHM